MSKFQQYLRSNAAKIDALAFVLSAFGIWQFIKLFSY